MSTVEQPAGAIAAPRIPRATSGARLRDLLFRGAMLACLGLSFIFLGAVFFQIVDQGAGTLSFDFLTSNPSPLRTQITSSGIYGPLIGTLWLIGVCAFFIVPVGVATAVYLEEYADASLRRNRLIEVNIQNLAAVPSVVYGLLGLAFLVRGPLSLGRVVLAGGLTLGLLVLPVVIIAGREAIRAVPPSIREGSLALGATKWQTIWKQVLPASVPGIATGVILALSRAIGETAPLLVLGGATYATFVANSPFSEFTSLPIQIFVWIDDARDEVEPLAAAAILVLMAVLLLMNSGAIWLRNRYEQKW